jgi:enoyl-[acyl-carrier protein] reductase III
MDSQPLLNQLVLVTGSSRGIGKEIALYFASQGADVVINYLRNEKNALEVVEQIKSLGRRAAAYQANIARVDHIEELFEHIRKDFGYLDIFISNAASGFNRPAMQQKESGWDYTFNLNAKGFLFCVQQAVPLMQSRGGGKIVAISSPGAHFVLPDYASVGPSKAALESVMRYLAVELAPQHVRVNAISPGVVETDALKHFSAMGDAELIPRIVSATPAGRLVAPRDVAGVAAFLCSSAAEMICGQVITMDGGFTLQART